MFCRCGTRFEAIDHHRTSKTDPVHAQDHTLVAAVQVLTRGNKFSTHHLTPRIINLTIDGSIPLPTHSCNEIPPSHQQSHVIPCGVKSSGVQSESSRAELSQSVNQGEWSALDWNQVEWSESQSQHTQAHSLLDTVTLLTRL